MKVFRSLLGGTLAVVLAASVAAYYWTRDSAGSARSRNPSAADEALVDTSQLQRAVSLASLAATRDEQAQAREAWQLADHELDLTYAAALREAEAQAAAPTAGPLRQLSDRIADLKLRVDADQKRVDALGAAGGDDLDRAQAQLTLDQDELDDAQQDLARDGGDKREQLARLLQEHASSDKVADQDMKFPSPAPTGTMREQVSAWLAMGDYEGQLQAAAQAATAQALALLNQHNALERQVPAQPDASASTARLKQLAGQRKDLSSLDERIQDTRQLATVYQRWSGVAETRRRAVLHLLLGSLAAILGILLATVLLNQATRHLFHAADRRRLHQLRLIVRIALQVAAVLAILLVIFGPPTQLSTIIGLVTAGLTVVMKDFIVAFFGWFTLMGKNGIRVGDWVEIEGVSGEVIEIGVFKTVLLELGNWTETGHPTGRRVAFSNSFAMERHYFNFSTGGQWLWDEIRATLPPGGDPYEMARKIREIVDKATEADAGEAAKDWERVTRQYGAREFSAKPAVELRPGTMGLDVVVRYITRAQQRNAVKTKVFDEMVEVLRQPAMSPKQDAAEQLPQNRR